MRGNFINTKKVYKKLAWVIIILFIFVCQLAFTSKNKVKADDNVIQYTDQIKILEIEPGNKYRLTNNSTSTPRDETISTVAGVELGQAQVVVTHITMTEFISMVDEINGQYDMVVVGRKNDGLASEYSDNNKYRDYTNPSSQLMPAIRYSESGSLSGFKQLQNPKTLADGRTYVEYYPENDITAKRAKEIQAMIESNQLVYMEDTIFSSTGDKDISKTKLYTIFNAYDSASYTNLKKVSAAGLNLKNVLNEYLSLSSDVKRPKITEVTKPNDDKDQDTASVYNRTMDFKLKVSGAQEGDNLKVKIYLDINADGLFKDNELYKTENIIAGTQASEYDVRCNLDNGFVGYLDWKMEVVREKTVVTGTKTTVSEVKSNIVSNSQYKPLNEKRTIRILQVHPDNKSGSLYLDNNITDANKVFNYLLNGKDANGKVDKNNFATDYKFDIDCIKYDAFNSQVKAGTLKLNGKYDMVIIGFSDNYGDDEISKEAIEELDSFVATGQSVMFTHDTMSIDSINNLELARGPKELTQHFRDYLGQSIFKDPLRLEDGDTTTPQSEVSEKDIYKNSVITRDGDGNITDYKLEDKNIVHNDFNVQQGTGLDSYTTEQKNKLYSLGATSRALTFDTTYDTSVKKINGAQISEYPLKLGTTNDDGDNNVSTFNVAKTHTQWYQINLEDPDVVPWYNLNSDKISSKFDDRDSQNYYYTYSRGNLTYSGTGHSNGYTAEELKLFINTIVKAERGANHAPEIKSSIPKENAGTTTKTVNEVIAGGTHDFTIDADDLEHQMVNMHVTIDGEELTADNISKTLEDRGGDDSKTNRDQVFSIDTTNNDRTAIQITIPNLKLQKVGDQIIIKIDATDVQGAKSEKNYILQAVEAPKFQINTKLTSLNTVNQSDVDMPTPARVDNSIKVEKTNRVKAGYTITPQELTYGQAVNNTQKEIAILIDKSMTDQHQEFTNSRNGIRNSILKGYLSQDVNNNRDDVKIDLITYGNNVANQYVDSQAKDQNGYLLNYRDQLQQKLDAINSDNSTQRKLGGAIEEAVDFFDENNQNNSAKTIIIIASRDPTDSISQVYLNKIKAGNYNVITLAIDNSAEAGNIFPTLLTWHNELGGLPSDYYISKPDNVSTGDLSHNKLDKELIPKIATSLASFKYRTYVLKNVKLKFNLGPDILADKRLIDDPSSDNTQDYIVNIPNIKYIATEENTNGETKLVYHGYFVSENSTDTTTTEEYYTDFIIKPNEATNVTNRMFSKYKLFYTNVINGSQEDPSETPILIVDSAKVEHGVYKGIGAVTEDGNQLKEAILDNNELKFAKGSIVTFGANITNMNNTNNTITVTINSSQTSNSNAAISKKPKAYIVQTDGSLRCLENVNFNQISTNVFVADNFDATTNHNIVVLYSIKLSNNANDSNTNNINVDGTSKIAIVTSSNNELPDLF